jgi:hypothetical protein
MTTERDPRTRIVLSWLREEAHENAERVLLRALDEVDATPQRRSWWPAWRTNQMNKLVTYGLGAAAVVVALVIGTRVLGPSELGGFGNAPSASPPPTLAPSPSMSPTQKPSVSPETYVVTPFAGPDGLGICGPTAVDPTCVEDPRDDSITFTFDAPASWEPYEGLGVWIDRNAPPDGAALFIYRGNWLHSNPCRPEDGDPDVAVGPTVDDLVTALVDHPSLEVTSPVDVTLAGYSGKYLDLLVPDDISACAPYQPIEQHIYAQGPGHRWHMWVLDVGGIRVLVETNDYAGTSAQRLAEVQAMIDSLEINP